MYGVQERDLGFGIFHSNSGPMGEVGKCRGMAIYDATHGSLRLTERLATELVEVIQTCITIARHEKEQQNLLEEMSSFLDLGMELEQYMPDEGTVVDSEMEQDWAIVPAQGEKVFYRSGVGVIEVIIKDYKYTPKGLLYELEAPEKKPGWDILERTSKKVPLVERIVPKPGVKWLVAANAIEPIPGITRMAKVNLVTGELLSIE